MNETQRRWCLVAYKSKADPEMGIDYTFGEKAIESTFFPTEQAAYGIQSLMTDGVMFTLNDGRKYLIYEFGVEKIDDCKYAIYTEHHVPANPHNHSVHRN